MYRLAVRGLALVACAWGATSCGDPAGPAPGSVHVRFTHQVVAGSQFSYTIGVGEHEPATVQSSQSTGSVEFERVPAGEHPVTVTGLPGACFAHASSPTARVTPGGVTTVELSVECMPQNPVVIILTTTGRDSARARSFMVSIEGGWSRIMDRHDTATVYTGYGERHLVVEAFDPCHVVGGRRRLLNFDPAMPGPDTVRVEVKCTWPGDLYVTVATTGEGQDADGYTIGSSWGGSPRYIKLGPSGFGTIPDLGRGPWPVTIEGVSPNCRVAGGSPQVVDLVGDSTVHLHVDVHCYAGGNVRIVSTLSGTGRDADGFRVEIDTFTTAVVPGSAGFHNAYLAAIPRGTHVMRIRGLAPHCSVTGGMVRTIEIPSGSTIQVDLGVTCGDVHPGGAGVSVADPVGDTIASAASQLQAWDVVRIDTRYEERLMHVTLEMDRAIDASLRAVLDLDTDEDAATGGATAAAAHGSDVAGGSDYRLVIEGSGLVMLQANGRTTRTSLRASIVDRTLQVIVPLQLLDDDDGSMRITGTFGSVGRVTDLLPNAGSVVTQHPGG